MPDYYKIKYANLAVNYLPVLDGGGMTIGQQYLDVVRTKLGHVGHVFEYCAGPGFIGFSLLANGLCDRLTLADINADAVKAVRATIAENHLEDRVTVYESDCLDHIPETEKWDLVVSNPPHFDGDEKSYREAIRLIDPGWVIHKKFYRDVKKFLNPGASIIFQENGTATRREDFEEMIRENGLTVVDVFANGKPAKQPHKVARHDSAGLSKLARRLMLPVERALMNPTVERVLKDNNFYRRFQALPIFMPSNIYFIWSKVQPTAQS
jgi:16S rRNA G966 N2-methylase RsmD